MNRHRLGTGFGLLLLVLGGYAEAQQRDLPEEDSPFEIGFRGERGPEQLPPNPGQAMERGIEDFGEGAPAAAQVTAVADTRSNSVIVRAPANVLAAIDALMAQMDTLSGHTPQVSVRPLRYANAEEMADLVENVFENNSSSGFASQRVSGNTAQLRVTAKADLRTNSVVISAASDKMPLILRMIDTIDQNPARDMRVHVYKIKNADTATVAQMLQSVVAGQTSRGGGSSSGNTGASSTFQPESPFARSSGGQGSGGALLSDTGGFGDSGGGFGDSGGGAGGR